MIFVCMSVMLCVGWAMGDCWIWWSSLFNLSRVMRACSVSLSVYGVLCECLLLGGLWWFDFCVRCGASVRMVVVSSSSSCMACCLVV